MEGWGVMVSDIIRITSRTLRSIWRLLGQIYENLAVETTILIFGAVKGLEKINSTL